MKTTQQAVCTFLVTCALAALLAGCGEKNADNLNVGAKPPSGPPPGVVPATVPAQAQGQVQQAIQHGQADGAAYAAQQKAHGAAQQAPK